MAQYGLYPDWIEDLGRVAEAAGRGDGARIKDDLARGAEAYLQTWERAYGIAPDSCRNPGLRRPVAKVRSLVKPGLTTRAVMTAVGQPYQRLGAAQTFCAKAPGEKRVLMEVTFSRAGRVLDVRRA